MRKNVASQIIAAQLINKTTGASVTTGSCTVYVTVNGGTQAAGAGTVTHEGNGEWSYAPTQAETNGNHVAFTWTHTDAVAVTINVYPVSYDPTDSAGLGLSRIDVALSTLATAAEVADVKAKTDNLPSDPADQSAVEAAITAATSTLATAAALSAVADLLDAEITDILTDTDELQQDWTDGGRLDLLIDAITTAIANVQSDANDIQTRLPAALVSGRMDSYIGSVLTAAAQDIADAVLKRGASSVEGSADTTSLTTVILALLESSISGSTWTIRKTDGTTFVQKTLTTDPYAEPIASVT